MGGGYHGGFGNTAGSAFAGDVSFMRSDEAFLKFIRKRVDVDPNGKFDIIAHGSTNSIQVVHNGSKIMINSRTAAKLIQKLPGYHGQSIRLLACSTGANKEGFAQNLANKLGVNVYAPSDMLWAYGNGQHIIAEMSPIPDKYGNPQPDLKRLGKFIKYTPGGNK